uniref:Retrovirus-related Pol polyprotein from transposon TNT 1-94 n=1 Tax=Cajanus cajan TaxID=3821 RepID=A0A151RAW0_CAJCA|nr:Retrovirus-related Pol polyprotein from transposon TNT 1-94 [Cajanus cajan]
MIHDASTLKHCFPCSKSTITTANGGSASITGQGTITLSKTLTLHSVLVVPSLDFNLLSVSRLTSQLNCSVIFWPTFCVFQDIQTKVILGYGVRRGNLYFLDVSEGDSFHSAAWLWHKRLGHLSFGYLQKLFPHLFSNCHPSKFQCSTCEMAKSHRIPFYPSLNKSCIPFQVIHSDIWGPAKVPSFSHSYYYVSFIDECTRMVWISLLKHKNDVFPVFQKFHNMVQTQFNTSIQIFQTDNGLEYKNGPFSEFLTSKGIKHQTSCTYTPQQNGLAERKNRQLLEVVRASLFDMNVPSHYWGEAVLSAAYLINRTPSSVLGFLTPQQKLETFFSIPHVMNLEPRVFGCTAYVHVPKKLRSKLDPCAKKCIFVGYSDVQKGYRCFDPQTHKMHVTLEVSFRESEPFYSGGVTPSSSQGEIHHIREEEFCLPLPMTPTPTSPLTMDSPPNQNPSPEVFTNLPGTDLVNASHPPQNETPSLPYIPESHVMDSSETHLEPTTEVTSVPVVNSSTPTSSNTHNIQIRRSERQNKGIPKPVYEPDPRVKVKYPISSYVSSHRLSESYALTVDQLSIVSIPNSVQEALEDPRWKQAMNIEMEALQKNETWKLTSLPSGKKTIGCKWVYTVKLKADGSIDKYKARLVAKGYTQKYGVDYQDTFAPVAKLNTIRILISIAANRDWPLKQFDVKNAFLNGDLEEEVYMEVPPGVQLAPSKESVVCKLKKALYGLKQSPRAWFGRLTLAMKKFGYKQSNSDHTLFIKHTKGKVAILIVYVDDMVLTGDDVEEMKLLEKRLAAEFEMKDLGQLKYFLGIEIARSEQGISLSQRKYVLDLLSETGMLACKPADTPIEMNHSLAIYPDQIETDKHRYQRLVGKLIYLSHTRPDIAYSVSIVSRFMHSPSEEHMTTVYRILKYLKGSPGKGLLFSKNDRACIKGYTDSDWAGDKTTRQSTSGYFTFVEGNLVTWRSKKQKVVARSSAKAEFRGMAYGICELLWIRSILADLGIKYEQPMNLFCDNKAVVEIAHNPVQHDRTKHVEVDRHFIKEKLDNHVIQTPYVRSEDQLVDVLTKAVSGRVFEEVINKLGMIDIHAPT